MRAVDLSGSPIAGVEMNCAGAGTEQRTTSFLGGLVRVTQPDTSLTFRTDGDGRFTSRRIRPAYDASMFTCQD